MIRQHNPDDNQSFESPGIDNVDEKENKKVLVSGWNIKMVIVLSKEYIGLGFSSSKSDKNLDFCGNFYIVVTDFFFFFKSEK